MYQSMVRRAAEEYMRGNFSAALILYRRLADQIGEKNFRANIQFCEHRIKLSSDNSESNTEMRPGSAELQANRVEEITSFLENDGKESLRPSIQCLPFEMPRSNIKRRLRVASVLDSFSQACFEPECELISITPEAWQQQLLGMEVDLLLVESAWHGNDDSWLYRVASYERAPGNELSDVIRWAKKNGIPTVFWNKEDPANFDRFIDRAVEFDFIFTTDENCIERYRLLCSTSTSIAVLPFAAQPRIHNSVLDQPRNSRTCFAGTYYADDFERRRKAMDMLLQAASRYGLDIFDRMYGLQGTDKKRFQFPPDLQKFVRGALIYQDMLKAYRHYRVALNVNSVSDSPTMFSRRVFELLACGTPVVSTESLGIRKMFKELVPTVESEYEANLRLGRLMTDDEFWIRTSVLGMREVYRHHTYRHRIGQIAKAIGLNLIGSDRTSMLVVVFPNGDEASFAGMLAEQCEQPDEIVVVSMADSANSSIKHQCAIEARGLRSLILPAQNIPSYVRNRHASSLVAICESRHYYGPAYLLDARISMEGSSQLDASTIESMGQSARSFKHASRIGLLGNRAYKGSIIVSAGSSFLSEALNHTNACHFDAIGFQISTRAGFDFMLHYARSEVADPHTVNLR